MSWDILPKANLKYFLSKLKEKFDLKVDKESGKGLSTNDYTTNEKNKLSGIAANAEVNVQSDWSETDSSSDAFILNKPTIPAAQVQSDWAQTDNTQPDFIKNKPSAPSGQVQADWAQDDSAEVDYIKNKPTIPDAQIQSDWNQTTTTAKDYIKNKPTIPAAQVNSDWNASSGVTQILNKPTIPDAQIQADWEQDDTEAVDYIKNKPTMPDPQIQSDWAQDDDSEVDYIKNKPTLATVATSGDYEDLTNTPDIPTISDTYDGTSQDGMSGIAVKSAIDALPEPMVFKGSLGTGGTITALPVDGSASRGDTYKVITDGTYASQPAKVGDSFICDSKTSSANTWTHIPSGDEPSGTITSVTIKATSPISIDSSSAITTSGTRTLSHANSGATAGSYGDSSAQTPDYGDTFKVPYVTVNETGHVTSISEHTVKIPASDNTDEKVKQVKINDASWHTIPLSQTNNTTTETATLEKSPGLMFINNPIGTASANGLAYLVVGNSTKTGNADNYKGKARLYDANNYRVDLATDTLTDHRDILLPDKDGTLAITGDIPTVNNATLTIQKNGTTVKTFTANASSNVTCNITVPTKTSDITNDSNYVSDASYVHTDNNYTTTEKNKLSGIASGAEVNVQSDWSVTNTSSDAFIKNKPTIPAAQVNSDWNSTSGVAEILNKPTTISGYGITDAKINNGTITLGSDTITPLTQHQDISGKVDKSGDTITGTLILSKTQDASGTANNKPALIVGGTDTQAHLEFDANEIIAKSNGTTPTTLYINNDGGTTVLGGYTFKPNKVSSALITGTGTAGSTTTTDPKVYTPALWKFNTKNTVADGDIIYIKIPIAGHTNGVYVSIDNGTSYQPVVVNGTSLLTTHYGVGLALQLLYESSATASVYPTSGGTEKSTVTGCWRVVNFYNTNTNTYVTQTATDTTNADYEVLFSNTADNTTRTEAARKTKNLIYNPSTTTLTVGTASSNPGKIKIYGSSPNCSVTLKVNGYTGFNNDIVIPSAGGTLALNSQLPTYEDVTVTTGGTGFANIMSNAPIDKTISAQVISPKRVSCELWLNDDADTGYYAYVYTRGPSPSAIASQSVKIRIWKMP